MIKRFKKDGKGIDQIRFSISLCVPIERRSSQSLRSKRFLKKLDRKGLTVGVVPLRFTPRKWEAEIARPAASKEVVSEFLRKRFFKNFLQN